MMKELTKEVEIVENEGLVALLGQKVLLMCANYFYGGKLVGVNDSFVQLEDAVIVYETGEMRAAAWSDAQRLPADVWYVQTASIESFGIGK